MKQVKASFKEIDQKIVALLSLKTQTDEDKRWVDLAAARPGRFDLIIDVDVVEPAYYYKLVEERCAHKEIVDLFTHDVIRSLQEKNVSGAFIINLLKHLEITQELQPEKLDGQYVLDAVRRMHRGFYKNPKSNGDFGFVAN
mgnify:CR=1 FL=1